MIDYCNISEPFVREATHVLVYNKEDYTFNQQLRSDKIDPNKAVLKFHINDLKSFSRRIDTKYVSYNRYTQVSMILPVLSLSETDDLLSLEGRNKYVVELFGNGKSVIFGNHREPMSIDFHNKIKDNGSGKDLIQMKIKGDTTIRPRPRLLPTEEAKEYFRVVLFTPQMIK